MIVKMSIVFAISFITITSTMGQEDLPLREIPAAPTLYTAENAVARMLEGLGFRYYWATEGLRPEDLSFKPSDDARTTGETLEHIYGLAELAYNSVVGKVNVRPSPIVDLTFEERREKTLFFIDEASSLLRSGDISLEDCKIIFERTGTSSEFPFWNNINGPIADALWHCGQVVSFRRSSGNPLPKGPSMFSGTVRE